MVNFTYKYLWYIASLKEPYLMLPVPKIIVQPYFLTSFYTCETLKYHNNAAFIYRLIKDIKKVIKRKTDIFKVKKIHDNFYQIECSKHYKFLVECLQRESLVEQIFNLPMYENNPYIELFVPLKGKYFSRESVNLASPMLSMPSVSSMPFYNESDAKKISINAVGFQRCKNLCELLNTFINDLTFQCNRPEFKKRCGVYERNGRETVDVVKTYITDILGDYPNPYLVELSLYSDKKHSGISSLSSPFNNPTSRQKAPDTESTNNNQVYSSTLDEVVAYRQAFIKRLQNAAFFSSIKGYLWKLSYSDTHGYYYIFNFFFDKKEISNPVGQKIVDLWLDGNDKKLKSLVGREQQTQYLPPSSTLHLSIFPNAFNRMSILRKKDKKELLQHILASFELERYLHLNISKHNEIDEKHKKITFGKKTITPPKKQSSKRTATALEVSMNKGDDRRLILLPRESFYAFDSPELKAQRFLNWLIQLKIIMPENNYSITYHQERYPYEQKTMGWRTTNEMRQFLKHRSKWQPIIEEHGAPFFSGIGFITKKTLLNVGSDTEIRKLTCPFCRATISGLEETNEDNYRDYNEKLQNHLAYQYLPPWSLGQQRLFTCPTCTQAGYFNDFLFIPQHNCCEFAVIFEHGEPDMLSEAFLEKAAEVIGGDLIQLYQAI